MGAGFPSLVRANERPCPCAVRWLDRAPPTRRLAALRSTSRPMICHSTYWTMARVSPSSADAAGRDGRGRAWSPDALPTAWARRTYRAGSRAFGLPGGGAAWPSRANHARSPPDVAHVEQDLGPLVRAQTDVARQAELPPERGGVAPTAVDTVHLAAVRSRPMVGPLGRWRERRPHRLEARHDGRACSPRAWRREPAPGGPRPRGWPGQPAWTARGRPRWAAGAGRGRNRSSRGPLGPGESAARGRQPPTGVPARERP